MTKPNHLMTLLVAVLIALGTTASWAAKAPRRAEELEKAAAHIVSGKVLEVTSKIRKSEIEKAPGIHRDEVFTITVQIETVTKGVGIKPGDKIQVFAWKPSSRIPPLPGLTGHEPIPQKGDQASFHLIEGKGKRYEPLLPNGIVIGKAGDRGHAKQPG